MSDNNAARSPAAGRSRSGLVANWKDVLTSATGVRRALEAHWAPDNSPESES